MAAGGTCTTDPVDTVHHEMDNVVLNDGLYKSV